MGGTVDGSRPSAHVLPVARTGVAVERTGAASGARSRPALKSGLFGCRWPPLATGDPLGFSLSNGRRSRTEDGGLPYRRACTTPSGPVIGKGKSLPAASYTVESQTTEDVDPGERADFWSEHIGTYQS